MHSHINDLSAYLETMLIYQREDSKNMATYILITLFKYLYVFYIAIYLLISVNLITPFVNINRVLYIILSSFAILAKSFTINSAYKKLMDKKRSLPFNHKKADNILMEILNNFELKIGINVIIICFLIFTYIDETFYSVTLLLEIAMIKTIQMFSSTILKACRDIFILSIIIYGLIVVCTHYIA